MALFLVVMRSGVIVASQIGLGEAIITKQVTEVKLLSRWRNLRSKIPFQTAGIKTAVFLL